MATQNLTRLKKRENKKEISVFETVLDYTVDVATSADVYQLFTLPPNCLVLSTSIYVVTASDAATTATANVGVGASAAALASAVNLKSAAGTSLAGTVPSFYETGGVVTFTPTYTGATTVGKFRVIVQYLETGKVKAELTNVV